MYTQNVRHDLLLFSKALLSNQVARLFPKLYVQLTGQTGRGDEGEDAPLLTDYFKRCFLDYQSQLRLTDEQMAGYLAGRSVLEYGPGDILGVALLMYAYGARQVTCIDRFPLSRMSDKNLDVYMHLLRSLKEEERKRAEGAFNEKGNPKSGFNPDFITYKVTKDGLSGEKQAYDLIISRAVLEHVNNLSDTLFDIKNSLKPDGISIHEVDLKSHGLDRYTDFDFLTWPRSLYQLMYSHKGFPNRWRVDKYREFAERAGLCIRRLEPTGRLQEEKIDKIYQSVSKEFRQIPREELSWMGFWMCLEHDDVVPKARQIAEGVSHRG